MCNFRNVGKAYFDEILNNLAKEKSIPHLVQGEGLIFVYMKVKTRLAGKRADY